MNKRSLGWLHPAVIYLILLILVIVVSWIGSIMEIGRAGGNDELALRSVRTAASCLGNAPVGNALMLFMAIGAGRGSGLFRALSRLRNLSPKESTAFYISLVVLAIYIFLIVLGVWALPERLRAALCTTDSCSWLCWASACHHWCTVCPPRLSAPQATALMLSAPYCLRSRISW